MSIELPKITSNSSSGNAFSDSLSQPHLLKECDLGLATGHSDDQRMPRLVLTQEPRQATRHLEGHHAVQTMKSQRTFFAVDILICLEGFSEGKTERASAPAVSMTTIFFSASL